MAVYHASMEQESSTQTGTAGPAPQDGWIARLGAVGPLAVASLVLPVVGGWLLYTYRVEVSDWLRGQGPLAFAGLFALLAGLAILPTQWQSLVGGYVFGLPAGAAASLAGVLGGAVIGYGIARLASGDRVTTLLESNATWRAVYHELLRRGPWRSLGLVTLVRLNSPFAATNLLLSATKVAFPIYAVGTLIGLAPRTIAFAYVGHSLGDLSGAVQTPMWLKISGIVFIVVVLAVIGQLAQRAIQRATQAAEVGGAAGASDS